MASKLPNYLKKHRKRYGLSESEMAYLLGYKTAMDVSRFERFQRMPTLRTALTYQAVFAIPVAELFAGVYQQIEREASEKARVLQNKLKSNASDRKNTRKMDLLHAIEITPAINKEHP